jgi:hypothetical protein
LGLLHPATRDGLLMAAGAPRSVVPGLDLRFIPDRAGNDTSTDEVRFFALSAGPFVFASRESITCSVTRDALSAVAGNSSLDREDSLETFHRHRSRIEQAARVKYLMQPVEAVGEVRLTRDDMVASGGMA